MCMCVCIHIYKVFDVNEKSKHRRDATPNSMTISSQRTINAINKCMVCLFVCRKSETKIK